MDTDWNTQEKDGGASSTTSSPTSYIFNRTYLMVVACGVIIPLIVSLVGVALGA